MFYKSKLYVEGTDPYSIYQKHMGLILAGAVVLSEKCNLHFWLEKL